MMTGYPIIVRHPFKITSPASWQSALIRKLDGDSWANHCAVILDLKGKRYVVEARGSGVFMSTWENWLNHRPDKKWRVGIPNVDVPVNMEERILGMLGRPYDKESLYLWHPQRIWKEKMRKEANVWNGGIHATGSVTCSEFLALLWKDHFSENWYKATTGDIVKSGIFTF